MAALGGPTGRDVAGVEAAGNGGRSVPLGLEAGDLGSDLDAHSSLKAFIAEARAGHAVMDGQSAGVEQFPGDGDGAHGGGPAGVEGEVGDLFDELVVGDAVVDGAT